MKNSQINVDQVTFSYPFHWKKKESLKSKCLNFFKIKKKQKSADNQKIFDKINFHFKSGDRIGFVGPNGSGKTTLLKLIAGIYEPDSGTVNVTGKITSVFELGDGVNENLSGYNNIKRILLLYGIKNNKIYKITKKIIKFSGLGSKINHPYKTYSSGMKLRLQFSSAAFLEPDILLLDEMFGMGDEDFREKALKKVDDLVRQSSIFIFSSHDSNLIKRFCNRVILVDKKVLNKVNIKNLR